VLSARCAEAVTDASYSATATGSERCKAEGIAFCTRTIARISNFDTLIFLSEMIGTEDALGRCAPPGIKRRRTGERHTARERLMEVGRFIEGGDRAVLATTQMLQR
jgi:hypothetical protein